MENHIGFLEQNDDIICQQQYFHDFNDPIACYMDNFINSKTWSDNSHKFGGGTNPDLNIKSHIPSPLNDEEIQ